MTHDPTNPVSAYLAKTGSAGGKSRSERKVAAVRANLAKARAKRWAGHNKSATPPTT